MQTRCTFKIKYTQRNAEKKPKTLSEKLLAALEGEKAEDILDDELERPRTVGDDLDSDEEVTEANNDKSLSHLRTANLPTLSELDPRYSGEKVSRKDLDKNEQEEAELGHMFEIGSEENDDQDSEENAELEEEEESEYDNEEEEADGEVKIELEKESDDENSEDDGEDHFATLDESNDMEVDSSQLLFEKDDSEVEKGNHIRNQLIMYDKLLEMRIQLQKEEDESALEECRGDLRDFLESSLKAKNELVQNNEDLRKRKGLNLEGNDGTKRVKVSDFENCLSDFSSEFGTWRNEVLGKWNEKTRLVSSTNHSKTSNFSCFDVSVFKQIENILSDKERLLSRTRIRRIEYDILGEEDWDEKEDPDIFDDGDFYHQLLRELISAKTAGVEDPNELGRQWLEVQKIRSKMKKKLAIDTKASKGRKIRYDIHAKLVNFMAPVYFETMNDEAKNELYSSLFGRRPGGTVEP
ncbi:AATF [Lepeophtheirus salmonis]|uniref:AATF n=1 Tax=Lepeophtheirus salmonis TaxID=72036 RepID=A0A7R8D3W8_LEPSM|nr:AATF [Lepeophtheirus salmonis]CAF3020038.1 AATF [Lepeophtheirus salmonis]